jgi:hypothetical protein
VKSLKLNIHITEKTIRGAYGHEMRHCDPGGCAAISAIFLDLPDDEVEVGNCYEVEWSETANGTACRVVAAIE